MSKNPALVGIVPRKNLWNLIQSENWYHIPVQSAPKNAAAAEYLAFYFPQIFGDDLKYKVSYYARVKNVEIMKRLELFPAEPDHERAGNDYFKFSLGKIKELPRPIPSQSWRRIVHIPTNYEKLFSAEEINDLYDTSPLEEKMYEEMKKRKIVAERQFHIRAGEKNYYLDFGIFCRDGNIDVECDGEKYHVLPEALARDRARNNKLTSFGWSVLRFSGKEINRTLKDCFKIIETTIKNLKGSYISKFN
jgi:very-short-patch-repair endonuclease